MSTCGKDRKCPKIKQIVIVPPFSTTFVDGFSPGSHSNMALDMESWLRIVN